MTERRGVATGAQQTARDGLAEVFDTERPRLHAIAYRLLGSHWDADDAVQEAWIRLQNSDVRSTRTSAPGSLPWSRGSASISAAGPPPGTRTSVPSSRTRCRVRARSCQVRGRSCRKPLR